MQKLKTLKRQEMKVLGFWGEEGRLGESASHLLVRGNCLCHILSSSEVTIEIGAEGAKGV